MPDERKYVATLRLIFDEESDAEAALTAELVREKASELLEENDSLEVTQVIPFALAAPVEPAEMVNQMRLVADMLVSTRIRECYDLAREVHKTAWILEHRVEESFDASNYDYGEFLERAGEILARLKREAKD